MLAIGALIEYLREHFRDRGVLWAVHGGVAANAYRGEIRQTMDTDILVSVAHGTVEDIAETLQRDDWNVQYLSDGYLARLRHERLGSLDIAFSQTEYEHGAVRRATENADDDDIPVLTVEDVIIHKMVASRWRDDMDIVSILMTSPPLDMAYLHKWLTLFEKDGEFERLRAVAKEEAAKARAGAGSAPESGRPRDCPKGARGVDTA